MSMEQQDRHQKRSRKGGPMDNLAETEPLISSWRPSQDFQSPKSKLMASPASGSNTVETVQVPPARQHSVVTIFAIWNTMMGTSLLAMPWGVERAGLFLGAAMVLVMGALCLYTAYCNIRTHQQFGSATGEISELVRTMLGPVAEVFSKLFSIIVLLGATIVYWILMSNFLYNSVSSIYDAATGSNIGLNISSSAVLCPKHLGNHTDEIKDYSTFKKIWNLEITVPMFLCFVMGPLLNFKSPTFFTKFNSLGTVSVMYLVVFVFVKAQSWGFNVDISNPSSTAYTPLAASGFPATSGMLALSYFIHNIIITVMRNNSNQKNNGRDLSIAYALVTLTYFFIAIIFYVTFPLVKSCIEDNFLNNFSGSDLLTIVARMFLLFQLVTVFPLVAYVLRVQTLMAFTGKPFPGMAYVFGHNFVLLIICILFAVFLPKIGTIIRYTGSISGLVHIFTLPCLLRLAAQYKNGNVTTFSWVIHLLIPIYGAVNLLGQFFVKD